MDQTEKTAKKDMTKPIEDPHAPQGTTSGPQSQADGHADAKDEKKPQPVGSER